MARKIKNPDMFDISEPLPSKAEIRSHIEQYTATANAHVNSSFSTEDKMVHQLDRHRVMEEFLMELLPQWKLAKETNDPNEILHQSAPHAARALMASLFVSDGKVRNQAAKDILDRELGKPIERQMNINADIHRMSEREIDNDIIRIFKKLGPEAFESLAELADELKGKRSDNVFEEAPRERSVMGREENRTLPPKQDPEEVS